MEDVNGNADEQISVPEAEKPQERTVKKNDINIKKQKIRERYRNARDDSIPLLMNYRDIIMRR